MVPILGATWRKTQGNRLLPFATFLLLGLATLAAWQWQSQIQNQAETLANNQESAAITADIRDQLILHGQFLRSLNAFAASLPTEELSAWRRFAKGMDIERNLVGTFAFAYAPAFRDKAPDAPLSLPVRFVAPETPALNAVIGFDLLSETARREAINRAYLTGNIAMTAPLEFRPDLGTKRLGFMLVQTISRSDSPIQQRERNKQDLAGVVLTAYRFDDFMSSFKLPINSRFALQIFDEALADDTSASFAETLVFDSDPGHNYANVPYLHHEIDFGGRNWVLHFVPRGDASPGLDTPVLVLYGGLLGSLLLALLVHHLTTHRARAERYASELTSELSQHRDHLQELVNERTASLDGALKQARGAIQAKSEFLANMSHELRTPMHAILGFVELASRRVKDGHDPRLTQYLHRIDQSGQRLLLLIDELLDLSKLDAGQMELTPERFDPRTLAQQVGAQLEPLLLQRKLQLKINCQVADPTIHADKKRITQLFFNLLSNAIKFSPEGSIITIELAEDALPTGRRALDTGLQPGLAIRFIDQGVGIPADELESIFDKFVQSSATKSGAGGTGLGLSICRAIVSQHRGRIIAHNNAGPGACFVVTLPFNCQVDKTGQND